MEFIETPLFSRQLASLLSDESFAMLQELLRFRPEAGKVVRRGGGIRKIRWAEIGRGKSGGVRVLYYWDVAPGVIYLLFMYSKSEMERLTDAQLDTVRKGLELYLG